MAASKTRTAREMRERGQKQMAVLMVLVAIPIAYFVFLSGPVSTYLDNRNTIAVANAEANQQSPLVRGDNATGSAVKTAVAPLSSDELSSRVEAAVVGADGASLAALKPERKGVVSFTLSSTPEQLAAVLASLQGDLRFIEGGQIRASGPGIIILETDSRQVEGGAIESKVKIASAATV